MTPNFLGSYNYGSIGIPYCMLVRSQWRENTYSGSKFFQLTVSHNERLTMRWNQWVSANQNKRCMCRVWDCPHLLSLHSHIQHRWIEQIIFHFNFPFANGFPSWKSTSVSPPCTHAGRLEFKPNIFFFLYAHMLSLTSKYLLNSYLFLYSHYVSYSSHHSSLVDYFPSVWPLDQPSKSHQNHDLNI